jgi:hypothetical protein
MCASRCYRGGPGPCCAQVATAFAPPHRQRWCVSYLAQLTAASALTGDALHRRDRAPAGLLRFATALPCPCSPQKDASARKNLSSVCGFPRCMVLLRSGTNTAQYKLLTLDKHCRGGKLRLPAHLPLCKHSLPRWPHAHGGCTARPSCGNWHALATPWSIRPRAVVPPAP